jgi:hypothetical protein
MTNSAVIHSKIREDKNRKKEEYAESGNFHRWKLEISPLKWGKLLYNRLDSTRKSVP